MVIDMYIKGFNQDAFIEWMEETFEINDYGIEIVRIIIEYAQRWEHVGKDQFAGFIADMLPDVELLDVAKFCEDGCLTDNTLKALGRK
jgi:hypothetical protein